MVLPALACAAVLIATAALAVMVADAARARHIVYGICLIASLALLFLQPCLQTPFDRNRLTNRWSEPLTELKKS